MEYQHFGPEHQADIIRQRMMGYERDHFNNVLNIKMFDDQKVPPSDKTYTDVLEHQKVIEAAHALLVLELEEILKQLNEKEDEYPVGLEEPFASAEDSGAES